MLQLSHWANAWLNNFFLRVYLLDRGEGREKERERKETSMYGCLSRAPYWEPGLQPRHVP